jgi:hypothetical protein
LERTQGPILVHGIRVVNSLLIDDRAEDTTELPGRGPEVRETLFKGHLGVGNIQIICGSRVVTTDPLGEINMKTLLAVKQVEEVRDT